MKKLLLALTIAGSLAGTAGAANYWANYQAVFCYPTGTYWQKQLAAYPDYYASHPQYAAKYGPGTKYCP